MSQLKILSSIFINLLLNDILIFKEGDFMNKRKKALVRTFSVILAFIMLAGILVPVLASL